MQVKDRVISSLGGEEPPHYPLPHFVQGVVRDGQPSLKSSMRALYGCCKEHQLPQFHLTTHTSYKIFYGNNCMNSNYYNRLAFIMKPEKYIHTQLMNISMSPYMQTHAV